MKDELSILIPIYNFDCTEMIEGLCRQADCLDSQGISRIEIIAAEDGSDNQFALKRNAVMAEWPRCRYIIRDKNVGRSAIRNYLATQANYKWILFLDCDMQLPDEQFIKRYLDSDGTGIVDGGFGVIRNDSMKGRNLRYTYEWVEQTNHSVEERSKNPYRSFRTTNFMIRRDIILAHPFDERFLHYGYEDVLFGKVMKQNNITILHIDNPMMLADLESNTAFMQKTEESLHTLYTFRNELRGFSKLLTFVDGIHFRLAYHTLCLWHKLFGRLERKILCGKHPRLSVFKLYKVGYYMTITNKQ